MLITKVHIEKFRGFINQDFEVGSMLAAIAGQNGTQKSTLLGMITQTFNAPESIVIVDGDVRNEKTQMKEVSASDNILILPSKMSPERFTATYLHDLSEADSLWETIGEGYTKQVCFKDYPYEEIMEDRIKAKEWFRRESASWGRNASKVLTPLFKKYNTEREEFVSDFMEMIKRYNI